MTTAKSKENTTLAEQFLQDARDAHKPVSIYLINGFQLKGEIVDFDQETILFSHKDAHQFVMRSAIASMYPLLNSKRNGRERAQTRAVAETATPS